MCSDFFIFIFLLFSNIGPLYLTIQTRGNVSSVNTQPVRCEVIGSLISTLREFRALCLLQKSKLELPVLKPDMKYFAPCQDDLTNLDMPVSRSFGSPG